MGRRPQLLKKSPTLFDVSWLNVKTSGRFMKFLWPFQKTWTLKKSIGKVWVFWEGHKIWKQSLSYFWQERRVLYLKQRTCQKVDKVLLLLHPFWRKNIVKTHHCALVHRENDTKTISWNDSAGFFFLSFKACIWKKEILFGICRQEMSVTWFGFRPGLLSSEFSHFLF